MPVVLCNTYCNLHLTPLLFRCVSFPLRLSILSHLPPLLPPPRVFLPRLCSETWTNIEAGANNVVALELNQVVGKPFKFGCWLFVGQHWARVVGRDADQIVSRTHCRY